MPRLIFKCPYLKPGTKKNRGGFAKYIATRDGVEKLPLPAAKNRAGYVEYMAQRPGAHGLFGAGEEPLNLAKVAEEISAHPGNIWTPIISLTREDAERLCYNNAESWRALAMAHAADFAKAMKIQPQNFVWYGAFHNEGAHPHMHMVCYSKNPREGFLTEKGIETIKSALARDIFQNELQEIYMQQTEHRDNTADAARESLRQALAEMKCGAMENRNITILMGRLAEKLQTHKGKMVYGYLQPPVKVIVNEIVDELAKTPSVADVYAKWWDLRQQVAVSYTDAPVERVPLSQNDVFKPVRNMVVKEAAALLGDELRVGMVFGDAQDIPEWSLHNSLADSVLSSPEVYANQNTGSNANATRAAPSLVAASARLLAGVGKIFESAPVYNKVPRQQMDRKRRSELQYKKGGKGIVQTEQEQGLDMV